ncbi:Predicted periplasmic lipoprotein [Serratia plymuthica]|nr:Predicted periplasmic lipoprotein [Serratia plymuthica]VEI15118.1 Predicted periplasmic lipoprotein [Serratia plymuthica]
MGVDFIISTGGDQKNDNQFGESFFIPYNKVREPPQSVTLLLLKHRQDVIDQQMLGQSTLQDGIMKTIKVIATSCILLATNGCSSVMSHTGPNQGYYPGTRASVGMLKDDNTSWAMMPLLALDLPFSAVMDTVLLPYDYMRSGSDDTADSPKARILRSEEQNLAASGNPSHAANVAAH